MSKSSPSPPPPKEIAQFEVMRRLGAGGMAEVFLAKKRGAEGTYKVLVLKRILPTHGGSRRFRSMFIEEAHLATRLNHPNVVQVYEFQDFGDEGLLLAMEHVDGCDLGRLMSVARAKGTRIPPWIGAWIIAEAAKGLHYAHEKKDEAGQPLDIVHRDVSPQNILLSSEGAVKIADFGIASARLFADEQGVLKGKFGYMSPEQARGESVDRRSDLYALGVILWEILAGRPIHGGLGGEALLDIVRSGIVEPPTTYAKDVPPELEEIALRTLAAARDERFPTGRELAAVLGRAIVKQGELIDASTLETSIGQLVPKDARGGDEPPASQDASRGGMRGDDARTQAAVPLARSLSESRSSARIAAAAEAKSDEVSSAQHETPVPRRVPTLDGPREVRHVAVVTFHLHGIEAIVLPRRTLDQLRGMLDDLAFKRGMRWVWANDADARAIAGLTANPSRAAIDATQLALDVHETISGFKEDLPTPVAPSIGIVRGIASGTRDPQGHLVRYVLHDPATYIADVLGHATPMARTWVAGGVYRLVRRDFRWGDAPSLALDVTAATDVPPTMRIYALERSLSREERLAEVQSTSSDLVGRDAEKADLHAAYHEAVSGGGGVGQLVSRAVVGEMGIGKTALVVTFLSELPPNARVVHVECTPVQMEVPYAAIAELVRATIGTTGEEPFEEVASLIARAGGGAAVGADAASPMVARLAELATNRQVGGGDEDAHGRRKNILAGVRNLLAAIALAQPLVLVLEGMHWGDKASLDLLSDVVHSSDPLPIFVLMVTRSDDRVLHVLEGVMRTELRGLSTEEQVRLVETRLGVRDGARQICGDLLPRVGGNPFFLLEMVDALLERGALEIHETDGDGGERVAVLVRTDRADADFGTLPSTLEQLLGDRLRELPTEEHAVVDWLAIAGGPLSLADVIKLTGKEDDEAVVRLCARGLCDRKGELADFRHPLTRDVAYVELDPEDRVRMHRALGEHLAKTSLARGVSAAIVARHLARGESYDRAADFYFEAANAARTSHQTPLAIRYYQRALSYLGPEDRRRIAGHEALESAYRMLGRRRERLWHLEALRRIVRITGSPKSVCLGLLRSARYDFDEGHLARGSVVARRAAEVAHTARVPAYEVEAEALVSDFLRELGDVQGALAACDRALAAFGPSAVGTPVPPRLRGEVLRSRGILLRRVGRVREAVDAYVDAIAIFRKCGARRVEARVKNALAYAMFVQGRYEDAVALALESIQIDLSIGGRFQIAKFLTNIGHAYFRVGDVPRALAYMKRAREAHDRYGDQDGWADTLTVSAMVMIELGDDAAAEVYLRDAGALNAATENAYDRTHETVVRSLLALSRREPQQAIEYALAARHAAEKMALVAFHFYAMAIEAAARVDLGEMHTATLVANTALGAVENLQGCEYGLEIRSLCADALKRAGSPQAPSAHQRAVDYARALMNNVRDSRMRKLFTRRPMNAALFETTPVPLRPVEGPSPADDGEPWWPRNRMMTTPAKSGRRRVAMILSGGGARGAYEVGVLWYVFDELTRILGAPPKIDILSGTSVGAINASFLAAHLGDPVLGMRRLVELWSELELTRVLGFSLRQVVTLPRVLLGGGEGYGLFDVRPMAELVQREISWRAVSRCLRKHMLRALTVSCTEVSTGRTVVFMQTSPDLTIPSAAPPRTLFRADRIGPHHALASAAIPLLFPPVRVDGELYLDGGLRQNTPIAPALRLGATHIFAIGSSREIEGRVVREAGHHENARAPGAAFLLGKVLNAFLLDHVDVDIELLTRINSVIVDGTCAYGSGFVDALSGEAKKRSAQEYRYVNCVRVRPSEDIGKLANDHLKRGRLRGDPILTKRLFNLLDMGVQAEANLASYLLFDGPFCRRLIEMGRADAQARRDELVAFFRDAVNQGGGTEEEPPDETGRFDRDSLTLGT